MAFRFTDGFDSYAATADLTKKWFRADSQWTWASGAGKFGGPGVVGSSSSAGGLLVSIPLAVAVGSPPCMGFWGKLSAAPSSNTVFAGFAQGNAGPSVGFQVQTSGKVFGFGSGAMTGGTGTSVCDGNWHWFEIETTNGFNGTTQVYVDSVLIGNGANGLSGLTVQNISFVSIGAGTTLTLDDVIFYDSTTGAPTNSAFPIGPRQISTTRPTSDGTIGFATASSGSTHFNLVNETVPDGDATYVQDATSGDQDLLNFGALGYTPSAISGVMLNIYADNPAGGAINTQGICKSGAAAQSNATAIATPVVYQTIQFSFGVDPNTSAAWTVAGLNAAQFGYRVA